MSPYMKIKKTMLPHRLFVNILLMTSQSIADDITNALWCDNKNVVTMPSSHLNHQVH